MNAIHSRAKLWHETIQKEPNNIHFSERSPLADRYIFGELMHENGYLDTA